MMRTKLSFFLILMVVSAIAMPHAVAPASAQVVEKPSSNKVHESTDQVKALNGFVDELLAIVARWQNSGTVKTSQRTGGYAGMANYFLESEYRDGVSDRLLARVRWVKEHPDQAQMIELFLHDGNGNLIVDYFVSYMIGFRNAPLQALINLHHESGELKAFRQFDLSGDRLYESCRGEYFGEAVDLGINFYDDSIKPDEVPENLYASCFGFLPLGPGKYTHPANLVAASGLQ